MNQLLLGSYVVLWFIVLFASFVLLGALRSLALVCWRLEQLEATTPSRLGRSGLKPGSKAPDFTLPSIDGSEVSLHDFTGQKTLLVFVQSGCGPCHAVVPALNQVGRNGTLRVVAIHPGPIDAARQWATETVARFPVVVQDRWNLSKRYQIFATPFAFLIDEQMTVASKGIVNNKQHIGFVLDHRRDEAKHEHIVGEASESNGVVSEVSQSFPMKETNHV